MSRPLLKQFPLLILKTITGIINEAYPCPRPIDAPLAERGLGNYAHLMRALTVEGAEAVRPAWAGAQVGDLIFATLDACGAIVGARLWTQEGVRLAPRADSGLATTGCILADYAAQNWLQGAHPPRCLWIAEGEPDFVSLSMCAEKLRPSLMREDQKRGAFYPGDMVGVLGIYSGAWSAEMGARCGEVAEVYICTHLDPAGERYAAEIRASIPEGVTVKRWVGGSVEGEDVNDMVRRGVDAWSLTSAIVGGPVMPPPPTSDAGRWAWSDASGAWSELESWAAARAKEKAWAAARSIPRAALDDALLERAKQWSEAKLAAVCLELEGLDGNRGRALAIMAPVMSLVAGGALDRGLVEGALTRAYVSGDRKTKADRTQQIKTAFKSGPRGQVREPHTLDDIARTLAAGDTEKHRGAGYHSPAPSPSTVAPKGKDGASEAVSGAQEDECSKELLRFDADGVAHVDVRYLRRDIFRLLGEVWSTLTIKSDQNTGKTEALKMLVQDAIKRGLRVLILTHRQALAQDLAKRLGARCYLDEIGQSYIVGKGEGLVLCVNSLGSFLERSRHEKTAPDLIIIDESEQVGRHLFSKTITDLMGVSDVLKSILKQARHVVCADADAGKCTRELIKWSGRVEGVLIQNNYHKWGFNLDGSNTVYLIKDRTDTGRRQLERMFLDAIKDIELGAPPIIAACTSKGQAEELARLLAKAHGLSVSEAIAVGLFICITSENKDEAHVKAFLADIAGSIKKYRAIIHSPTIGTGVSIDADVSQVFLFAKAVEGLTGPDTVQLMTRARNQIKPTVMWLQAHTFQRLPRNEDEAEEQHNLLFDEAAKHIEKAPVSEYMRKRFRTGLAQKALDGGEAQDLFRYGLTVAAEVGRTGRNPAQSTLDTLAARGAVVVEVEGGEAVHKAEAASLKNQAKEERILAMLAAPKLSDEELAATRQVRTAEAIAATDRNDTERLLGEDITEETARAVVERQPLYRGARLARVGALAEGGDVGALEAERDGAALLRSRAAIFDKKRHEGMKAGHVLEAFKLAGIECAVVDEGRGARAVIIEDECLDNARESLCKNRQALNLFGFTITANLVPPSEDADDKMRGRQRGSTKRWYDDVMRRLGFVNPLWLILQREIKAILSNTKPKDAQSIPEMWCNLRAYVNEKASIIKALGHKVGGGDDNLLALIKTLIKTPTALRVAKIVKGKRIYALDVGAVAEAWRWASPVLAEMRAEAALEATVRAA